MQHRLLSAVYVASAVVKGFGRGSKELGCPTANLEEDVVQGLMATLDDGIYYGFAQLLHPAGSTLERAQSELASKINQQQQQVENPSTSSSSSSSPSPSPLSNIVILEHCPGNPVYPMVCSLGWNPQYNNTSRTMEVHLLHDFGYDFYGSLVRVAVCGYIRPERKFDSVQALKETIQADIDFARVATEQPLQHWAHVVSDRFFQL